MDEFCAEIVAHIPHPLITDPIAEVDLIGAGHGGQILVEIQSDLWEVTVAPCQPTVSILVVVEKIPHQGLFEIHGDALGEQLPNESLAILLDVLIEYTVLFMIGVSQLVVDQTAHGIFITPM